MKYSSILLGTFFAAGIAVGVFATQGYAAMRGSAVFKDVPSGSYFDQHVGDLYGAGIVKGKGPGVFGSSDFVTRADIAVMIGRLRNEIKGLPLDPELSASSSSSRSSTSRSSSSSSSVSSSSSSAPTAAGALQFSISSLSIAKSAPRITIAVMRNGGTKGSVSVRYKTVDGSAKAGINYESMDSVLTFADGVTSQNAVIPLKANSPNTYNKDFTVVLSEPSGASLGSISTIKIVLLDQGVDPNSSSSSSSGGSSSSSSSTSSTDITSEFTAATYAVSEKAGTLTVTVRRNGSTSAATSVNYATSNQTATSGSDYTATNGTLNFASGETTKTFTVAIISHPNVIEGNKSFKVTLSSPSAGTALGNQANSTATIIDEDATPITGSGVIVFSAENYSVQIGRTAYITVQRQTNNTMTSSVNFTTSDRTAFTNADYTATSGTLTFLPGESSKTIPVVILPGAKAERQLNLSLNTPVNAQMGIQSSVTLTITN